MLLARLQLRSALAFLPPILVDVIKYSVLSHAELALFLDAPPSPAVQSPNQRRVAPDTGSFRQAMPIVTHPKGLHVGLS